MLFSPTTTSKVLERYFLSNMCRHLLVNRAEGMLRDDCDQINIAVLCFLAFGVQALLNGCGAGHGAHLLLRGFGFGFNDMALCETRS